MGTTDSDVLQGTLDLLILKALSLEPMHGWGVAQRIGQISEDVLQVNQGSLYPALHRLEQRGWIASSWGTSENNRRAKYYRLTATGRRRLDAEQAGWRRTQNGTPHLDSDGYQVIPQNVLVQYVDYVSSGVNDASGNPIPEAVLLGSGRGLLLTGGAALDLSWVRLGPGVRTVYYGPDGNEVRLAPGRTWGELLPSTSGVQLYR